MTVNPLSTALLTTGVFLLLALLGHRRRFLLAAIAVILLLWLAATPMMSHGLKLLLESRHAGVAADALRPGTRQIEACFFRPLLDAHRDAPTGGFGAAARAPADFRLARHDALDRMLLV